MKGDGTAIEFADIREGDRILQITRYTDGMIIAYESEVFRLENATGWWSPNGDLIASAPAPIYRMASREYFLIERPGPKEPTLFGAIVKFGGADPHLAVLAPVLSPKQWVGKYGNYTWTEIQAMGNVEVISEGVETNG